MYLALNEIVKVFPPRGGSAEVTAVDGVSIAIEKGGLNRALIRDALQDLSPWSGEAGVVRWNRFGQNERPARLATVEGPGTDGFAPDRREFEVIPEELVSPCRAHERPGETDGGERGRGRPAFHHTPQRA